MKWNKLLNNKISLRYFILLIICFMAVSVLFLGALRHQYLGGEKLGKWGTYIETIAEYPALVYHSFNSIMGYDLPIINKKQITLSGFIYFNKNFKDSGLILESVYDKNSQQSIIKLIAVESGRTIYSWIPQIKKKFGNQYKLLSHPYLLKDGSVIANCGGLLIKIDSLSKLLWVINKSFHHSVEVDSDSNIWVPCQFEPYTINPFAKRKIDDDAITKISPDGKVLFIKSVAQILLENKYTALLLGTGSVTKDVIHLNEIKPALYSSRYWEKGDLLISIRNKSTVFLYRPSTNKIIWLQTGPWICQHCPDFIDSSRISVFGNDVLVNSTYLLNGHNDIYIHDFSKKITSTPYSNMMRELKVSTPAQGRLKILSNGDVLIDETENGRIIRANKNGPIWIFENKFDENHIALSCWSRYLVKNGDCKFCLTENVK